MSAPARARAARELPEPDRVMVLWCPDWPIRARTTADGLDPAAPVALVVGGLVHACSAAARAVGVRRGLRIREAQARCPELVVRAHDESADARGFEPVLAVLAEVVSGVQVLRPGMCAVRATGPARFFGDERLAAESLLSALEHAGVPDARIGVADGPFAAEHAARATGAVQRVAVVPPGGSPAFVAPMPVGVLEIPALTDLLRRLGLRTLGAFAALDADDVRSRFGPEGARAHALARGRDGRPVVPREVPVDLEREIAFEPPLDRVDQVAFAVRAAADDFIASLTAEQLVCTALTVELVTDRGGRHRRDWLHPRSFSPAEVVDRVRWQLQGMSGGGAQISPVASISSVLLLPASVDAIGAHEAGLFGGGPDDRVHSGLARVQSMLGHTAVRQIVVGGGRLLADRAVAVPWGDRPATPRPVDRPWPGSLPGLLPATVYPVPRLARLLTPSGEPLTVDARDTMNGPPHRFGLATGSPLLAVTGWSGPWPVDERWWDPAVARRTHRFQIIDAEGTAWLVLVGDGGARAEARYD